MKIIRRILILSILAMVLPVSPSAGEGGGFKPLHMIMADDRDGGMKFPEGVACDDGSTVIVADTGNGRLLRYQLQDSSLSGGTETKIPQLIYPIRVHLSANKEIFALDGRQRRIVHLSADGKFVSYVDPAGAPAPATIVPRSFAIDASGSLFVLDIFGERVIVVDQSGKFQRQVAFPAGYGFFSDIAVTPKGDMFLVDSVGGRVYSSAAGNTTIAPLSQPLQEFLSFPVGIAVDRRGMILLSDQNGSAIVALGPDGSFKGRYSAMGWKPGLLNFPSQLCTGNNLIMIADRNNSRIQVLEGVK